MTRSIETFQAEARAFLDGVDFAVARGLADGTPAADEEQGEPDGPDDRERGTATDAVRRDRRVPPDHGLRRRGRRHDRSDRRRGVERTDGEADGRRVVDRRGRGEVDRGRRRDVTRER